MPGNIAFTFLNNGSIIRTDHPIFGIPDSDEDSLDDEWESAAINELSPGFSLDRNEEFFNHPEDTVKLFARVTPFQSAGNPQYIIFRYVVTWSRDYGKYGIGAHNGDTEPFIMIWRVVDNQTLVLDSVYIHAHEGCNEREDVWNATGISCNSAGVCDFTLREINKKTSCASLEFSDNRLLLHVSKDKHALFPSGESCRSSTLIEPSKTWNWTDPPGSILNAAGSASNVLLQITLQWYRFMQKIQRYPVPSDQTDIISDYFMKVRITEECSLATGDPFRFPAFNTGEPDHVLISNLTEYGFSNEPISGKNCGSGVRFSGGLPCDNHGATPVYTWLEKTPEIVRQRLS